MKDVEVNGYLVSMSISNWTDKITGESKSTLNNVNIIVGCDDIDDLTGKVIRPTIDRNCKFSASDFESAGRLTPVNMVLSIPDGLGNYVLKSISVGN